MTNKKHASTLLILMVVGLSGLVNAQATARLKAQVPFDFVANQKTIPAGECIITVVDRKILSINSGNKQVYVLANADESPNASKETAFVFHQYGGQYFLASVRREGKGAYQLPAAKLERELRARNVAGQEFVILASAK